MATWYRLNEQVEELKITIAELRAQFEQEEPAQITITTQSDINTNTLGGEGFPQKGKNVIINNSSNINYNVNSQDGFVASYMKVNTGSITFTQGQGRQLNLIDETAVMDGAAGSTATISSVGLIDYLRIHNV